MLKSACTFRVPFALTFGTAAWNTKSVNGDGPELVYVALIVVCCESAAGFEKSKWTRKPSFSNATMDGNVGPAAGAAPPSRSPNGSIAVGGCGAGAAGPPIRAARGS